MHDSVSTTQKIKRARWKQAKKSMKSKKNAFKPLKSLNSSKTAAGPNGDDRS
jgi:hypothetical protein